MRKWLISALGAVGALGAATAGFLLATEVQPLRDGYRLVRSQARVAAGLEKNWVSLPGAQWTQTLDPRPCPPPDDALVILVGGQSNAANSIPTPYAAGDGVSVWFQGKCYPASDPLPGATADDGSIWSLMGDEIGRQTSRPVVLLVAAIGGTQFRDWNDPRSGYYTALKERLMSAVDAGYRPGVILWHQGETDAKVERNMGALRHEMETLFTRLLDDAPSASLYLYQATRCSDRYRSTGVPAIRSVFQSVAADHPRIVLGMNTDSLGKEYRWDECHFNARGRAAIVEASLPQILAHLPLQP